MAKRHEGGRAYLLIAFDLHDQRILSTSEVLGPFEADFEEVRVDWGRLMKLAKATSAPPPRDPPWSRAPLDDDRPPRDPPWSRAVVDDDAASGGYARTDDKEEKPPEV